MITVVVVIGYFVGNFEMKECVNSSDFFLVKLLKISLSLMNLNMNFIISLTVLSEKAFRIFMETVFASGFIVRSYRAIPFPIQMFLITLCFEVYLHREQFSPLLDYKLFTMEVFLYSLKRFQKSWKFLKNPYVKKILKMI